MGRKANVTVAIDARRSMETEILSRAEIFAPFEIAMIIPVKPAIAMATWIALVRTISAERSLPMSPNVVVNGGPAREVTDMTPRWRPVRST
jgi:hypothetical protein